LRQFGPKRLQIAALRVHPNPIATMTTTTATTTTAADPHAPIWAESARIYARARRRAMCAWRTDPVDGRTRLVKDIAREHGATDREITRAYLRVSGGFRPDPLTYQDLDAYAAAWRDAIVRSSARTRPRPITYSVWCSGAALTRSASRVAAQRRAHAVQLGAVALRRPPRAAFLVIKLGLSPHSARCAARACSGRLLIIWLSPQARIARLRKGPIWAQPRLKPSRSFRINTSAVFTKGSHLGPAAPKAPALFSNKIRRRRRNGSCNKNSLIILIKLNLITFCIGTSSSFRRSNSLRENESNSTFEFYSC
jgi:hypothetical protein